jgi:hypothetical protein
VAVDALELSKREGSPQAVAYYANRRLFYWNILWFMLGNSAAIFGTQTAQNLMPLHMVQAGLTPRQISLVLATSNWIGIPMLLYVAHLSDNWQWRWGRRLPFVALATPFMVVLLFVFPHTTMFVSCLVGYSMYQCACKIKSDSYPYLAVDVSPQKYWGRITGLSGVLGAGAVWLGQVVLMPMVQTRGATFVFNLAGVLVLVTSLITLLFIKESPVRSDTPPRFNPLPVIWSTLKFGFGNKKRLVICILYPVMCGNIVVSYFISLQAKVNLQLTEGEIGRYILQYGTIVNFGFMFILGWLIDKIGTPKCCVIGCGFSLLAALLGYDPSLSSHFAGTLGLRISPVATLASAYICNVMVNMFACVSFGVFIMSCVKRTEVATFCACTGTTNLFMVGANVSLAGLVIERVFNGQYGFVFIASVIYTIIAVTCFLFLYKWLKPVSGQELENKAQDVVA